jgi:hypothetical protein
MQRIADHLEAKVRIQTPRLVQLAEVHAKATASSDVLAELKKEAEAAGNALAAKIIDAIEAVNATSNELVARLSSTVVALVCDEQAHDARLIAGIRPPVGANARTTHEVAQAAHQYAQAHRGDPAPAPKYAAAHGGLFASAEEAVAHDEEMRRRGSAVAQPPLPISGQVV